MACLGEMPISEASSSRVRRFSAPSQMSPQAWSTMRPVSWPLSTSSMLERAKSMPRPARTRSAKKVKPPDTSSVVSPAAFAAVISSLAPGLKRSRSVNTCSRWLTVTPLSRATRWRRLSL